MSEIVEKRELHETRNERLKAQGFVGWGPIIKMARETSKTQYYKNPRYFDNERARGDARVLLQKRDRDLVSTAILVGGRIEEILMLTSENFLVDKKFIFCTNVPLLKRYTYVKKVIKTLNSIPPKEELKEYKFDTRMGVFKKYEITTEARVVRRNDFSIPRWEPLTENLVERISGTKGWLFPTSKVGRRVVGKPVKGVQKWMEDVWGVSETKWISPVRSWQIVKDLGERCGMKIWNHWFRAQRASQLFRDYDFMEPYLNAYFGWTGAWKGQKPSTAEGYTGVGDATLRDRMENNKRRHLENLKRDLVRYPI